MITAVFNLIYLLMCFLSFDGSGTNGKEVGVISFGVLMFAVKGREAVHFTLDGDPFPVYALREKDEVQLHFGIFSMTSGLTLPTRQPSSQQPKSSDSNSFLSSCPIRQRTSSSMISDLK